MNTVRAGKECYKGHSAEHNHPRTAPNHVMNIKKVTLITKLMFVT
jgi:hypothetical protein